MEPVIYIVVGWVLGFLGTLLLQWINENKRKKAFRKSLCAELEEVIPQLAGTYFVLNDALGKLDRDIISWTHTILSKFSEGQEKLLKSVEWYAEKAEDQLKALASHKTSKKETMSIKRITLPFLQQNFSSVSVLAPSLQRSLATIERNVYLLNQEIDLYYFYLEKTFDSTLTKENYDLVNNNIDHAYEAIARLSHKVAESISRILPDLFS